MSKRAILSVFDKTGIVDFAKGLVANGYEIISTGGTCRVLKENGIPFIEISDLTGFPECLDGRVKTLHPMVHAGVLAMRGNEDHMKQLQDLGVEPIDLVAVNLYPFEATIQKENVTLADAIENIDIGGPTMLRAAAKNWQDVTVVCDPADYDVILAEMETLGEVDEATRFALAGKVFCTTAAYDALINQYLTKMRGESPLDADRLTLTFEKMDMDMRYGENPHQEAAFYKEIATGRNNSLADAEQLWGKKLSYNNINDANGALDTLKEFGTEIPCAVGVKHANPCGVGIGETLLDAWKAAYEADPVSIFGGIVAVNRKLDAATAEELSKIFLEIVIAPDYDEDALAILEKKKNIRILRMPGCTTPNTTDMLDMKKVAGGLLVQKQNCELYHEEDLRVVTDRAPTEEEMKQLAFAWKVVKHTKSNAIVLAKDNATTGVGPGQTNRVTALELAIRYAGDKAKGSVMASDAFFPFDDCVKAAAEAGITAIIQPGGSIRDADSIKACNEAGIAMVFCGMRMFKH